MPSLHIFRAEDREGASGLCLDVDIEGVLGLCDCRGGVTDGLPVLIERRE